MPRLIPQKHPYKPRWCVYIYAYKKHIYLEGWYVLMQFGNRSWAIMPNDKPAPGKQVKHAQQL